MGIKNIMQAKEDSRDCERGGLFIIIYVALVVTFGFTLLVTDVAIMIMTYYSVIGGWITEYLAVYLAGQGVYAAEEGYFTSFDYIRSISDYFYVTISCDYSIYRVQRCRKRN